MATRQLADLAFTRAGDKGDISDVTLFAPTRALYHLFAEQVTVERVQRCYESLVHGTVTRYEVPNVLALKFVLESALGGGGPSSLRADNLGKAMGGPLLRLTVEVPDEMLGVVEVARPPRDPYADEDWVVRDEANAHNGD